MNNEEETAEFEVKKHSKTEILVNEADITKEHKRNGGLTFEQKLLVDVRRKIDLCATKDDLHEVKAETDARSEKHSDAIAKIKDVQDNCVIVNAQKTLKGLGIKISIWAIIGGGAFYGIKELLTEIFKNLK